MNSLEEQLIAAAKNGKTSDVEDLLDKGVDVHTNNDGALQLAAENGHTETVKILLERGANVHACNDRAIRSATSKGRTEMAKLLLDHGADIHPHKSLALQLAIVNGHTETVKLLLDHPRGASINAALRCAVHYGQAKMLVALKAHLGHTMNPMFERIGADGNPQRFGEFKLVETSRLKGIRISVTADTSWLL